MERRHSLALAAVPLIVAGAALAFLGVEALSLERTEAARAGADWAGKIVATLHEIAPRLAAAEPYPADEVIHLADPAKVSVRAEASPAGDRLLLDEAEYLARARGDDAAALAILVRLAEPADGAPLRDVAALRAGTIARRLSDPRAAALLARAAAAPGDVLDVGDLPVSLLALRQLAPLDLANGSEKPLVALLDASHDGADLREGGSLDAGDLLLATADEVAPNDRRFPTGTPGARLVRAADRARRGHRLLDALEGRVVATDGVSVAARGKPGEVTVRSLRAFGSLLAARSGADVGVASRRVSMPEGVGVSAPLGPPLDELRVWARAEPGASSGRWGWFLGAALATYALGAALAISAIRGSQRAARREADFVAAVSHEMKTPIAAVQAMAEMLADGKVADPARARTYALRMQAEMLRLGATVRNVLDAARIERGGAPLVARRPLDPAAVVEDWTGVVRPVLEARGFRLDVEAKPAAGPVSIDPDAFASVLTNLIDNAAKFSGEAKELSVVAGPSGKTGRGYRVHVLDRGPGVPVADRAHVFERFWRGDAARVGAVPGVGLGLHVARELVLAHGGTIAVEDRAGGGADFVVDLPEEGT